MKNGKPAKPAAKPAPAMPRPGTAEHRQMQREDFNNRLEAEKRSRKSQ